MAGDDAVPEVKRLADVGEIRRRGCRSVGARQRESNAPEMQAVRIGAQPVDLGGALAGDVGVPNRATVAVEGLERQRVDGPSVRVRPRVPAPLGQRTEGNRLLVLVRERLEPRHIHRERKLPVADTERRLDVERRERRVVPRHECMPVDRGRLGPGAAASQRRQSQARHDDAHTEARGGGRPDVRADSHGGVHLTSDGRSGFGGGHPPALFCYPKRRRCRQPATRGIIRGQSRGRPAVPGGRSVS